jgi:probable phosphoglycerate mutase
MHNSTELLIIRHGETEANLQGRWQGHGDSPLTECGLAQAKAIGKRLTTHRFSSLYSSDLGRARNTAKIIAKHTGHKIVLDKRLREKDVGIFQGLTVEEAERLYPDEWRLYKNFASDYAIPNGESSQQRLERAISCLEDIGSRHPSESIVVVTHGGVLNDLLRHTLGIPPDSPRRFKIPNASLNIFLFTHQGWILSTWGDINHLNHLGTVHDG